MLPLAVLERIRWKGEVWTQGPVRLPWDTPVTWRRPAPVRLLLLSAIWKRQLLELGRGRIKEQGSARGGKANDATFRFLAETNGLNDAPASTLEESAYKTGAQRQQTVQ